MPTPSYTPKIIGLVSIEQACLTVALTVMVEVPVSALLWVPRMADPNTMDDMIARLRLLWLNFFFIIRLFC
ncbi:hypothetical protein OAI56_05410 [Amylibacter sp.]|nr:hypothetical protein [Amylibacter sp.]